MLKQILCFCILLSAPILAQEQEVFLHAPDFFQNEFLGYGVGIRPGRKGDFRLEVQTFWDKLLIHNYGHGGNGISLSWGCAELIADLLNATYPAQKPPIAILGSGVIGLTTACELLSQGYPVTVYATEFPPHTTSNIGTGIWDPFILTDQNGLIREVGRRAFDRFQYLAANPYLEGISKIAVYSFGVTQKRRSRLINPTDVTVSFDTGVTYQGVRWETIRIDGDLFLVDLLKNVLDQGGLYQQATFSSKEVLCALQEPVIINCLGLGAKTLFNDPLLVPIRGQLLYFAPQKDIDYVFGCIGDKHFYFIPWEQKLILGGTYEVGEDALIIDTEACQRLWDNALDFFHPTPNPTVLKNL